MVVNLRDFFLDKKRNDFPPILRIPSAERIRGIGGKFLNLEDFSFFFIEVLKLLLWYVK